MAEESANNHLGARLLIILYALGLVAIGAYPIQNEYGGIVEFLRAKTSAFAGEREQWFGFGSSGENGLLKSRTLSTHSAGGIDAPEPHAPDHDIDKINNRERKALSKFIDDL